MKYLIFLKTKNATSEKSNILQPNQQYLYNESTYKWSSISLFLLRLFKRFAQMANYMAVRLVETVLLKCPVLLALVEM